MHKHVSILFSFVVVVSFSLALFFFQYSPPVIQFESWITTLVQPLQRISYIAFAQNDNQSLQIKQLDIQKKLVQLNQLEKENAALKDQFNDSPVRTQNLLPVHIIGMPRFIPGISQPDTIILDAGEKQGISLGNIVIFKNVLLGKVTRVLSQSSSVQLLTDSRMSFTGVTSQTNALGIVQGKGNGIVVIANVVLSDKLQAGDIVMTKGDLDASGKGFPDQLVVGTIASVDKNPAALFQSASINRPINVTKLIDVFVVKQ